MDWRRIRLQGIGFKEIGIFYFNKTKKYRLCPALRGSMGPSPAAELGIWGLWFFDQSGQKRPGSRIWFQAKMILKLRCFWGKATV